MLLVAVVIVVVEEYIGDRVYGKSVKKGEVEKENGLKCLMIYHIVVNVVLVVISSSISSSSSFSSLSSLSSSASTASFSPSSSIWAT